MVGGRCKVQCESANNIISIKLSYVQLVYLPQAQPTTLILGVAGEAKEEMDAEVP